MPLYGFRNVGFYTPDPLGCTTWFEDRAARDTAMDRAQRQIERHGCGVRLVPVRTTVRAMDRALQKAGLLSWKLLVSLEGSPVRFGNSQVDP